MVASIAVDRCFTGGEVASSFIANYSLPYICIKDDISYIKTEVESTTDPSNMKTTFQNKVLRKYTINDWKLCRPEKVLGGPIMILSVTDTGIIHSDDYVCKNDCEIKVDKEDGVIILETKQYNYYQLTGTTIVSGWFRTITSISLKHTCENIKIQCGERSIMLHACFKHHMECYQALNKGILPKYMVSALCSNMELIILVTFILLIFFIFAMLAKTYLSYILLPIFIPISYMYGKLYGKCCKPCRECHMACHPFTSCSLVCVCGNIFETTNRLKMHRMGGLCSGYKYMMTARVMCKSKGCGLMLSTIVSIILFLFVKPIGGISTDTSMDLACIPLEKFPEIYKNSTLTLNRSHDIARWSFIFELLALIVTVLIYCFIVIKPHLFLRQYIYKCEDCKMFHSRDRIKFDEFRTNKCGSCTCGCPDDPPMRDYHQTSIICTAEYHIKIYKILVLFFIFISISNLASIGILAEECSTVETETKCWGIQIEKIMAEAMKKLDNDPEKAMKELFPTIDSEELRHLATIPEGYWEFLLLEKKYGSFRALQALEAYYQRNPSHQFTRIIIGDNKFIKWSSKVKLSGLMICRKIITSSPCLCVIEGKSCEMFTHYLNRKTFLNRIDDASMQKDMHTILKLAYEIIQPTTLAVYKAMVKEGNTTQFEKFADEVYKSYVGSPFIDNFLYIMMNMTQMIGLDKMILTPEIENIATHKLMSNLRTAQPDFGTQGIDIGLPSKKCKNPRRWICIMPRVTNSVIDGLLSCDPVTSTKYSLYKWTPDIVQLPEWGCRLDTNCLKEFENATEADKNAITTLSNCRKVDNVFNKELSAKVKYCDIKQKGTCLVNNANKQIVECNEGYFAEQKFTGHYDGSNRIDRVCLSAGCIDSPKIHPDNLQNCTISVPRQKLEKLKHKMVESIDNFKMHLEKDFLSALTQVKFLPTSGLPHIIPKFIPLTLMGVETIEGIESSYVLFDIEAVSGRSMGIQINTKDNVHLFDVVIFIKSSNISSAYKELYRTGRTITYNSVHDEHCTGGCPEKVPRKDSSWMSFEKERSSNWGCEEFGCLAINEGCLFGQCKDVIKPEAQVYNKITEEQISSEVCISTANQYYCKSITSSFPIITTSIEMQLFTVESFILPQRILIKDNKIFKGQINNLGEFNKYCGNVQMVNGTVIGKGEPKFDYYCHAARRKDVIIRKCYDNEFNSCLHLDEGKNLIIDDENGEFKKISYHTKSIGSIRIKLLLGDINYKVFSKSPDLDISSDCSGCTNCIQGISCHLVIKTSSVTNCNINSNCNSFVNKVIITPREKNYYLKFQCPDLPNGKVNIEICNTKVETPIKIVSKKNILEIATVEESPYIMEHDDRCPTWMCRVSEEGLGIIFSPITGFFTKAWHIILGVLIGLALLALVIYIILPMASKLKSQLMTHEQAYMAECKVK